MVRESSRNQPATGKRHRSSVALALTNHVLGQRDVPGISGGAHALAQALISGNARFQGVVDDLEAEVDHDLAALQEEPGTWPRHVLRTVRNRTRERAARLLQAAGLNLAGAD